MKKKNLLYKLISLSRSKLLNWLEAATVGVRAIVINDKKEILLVKHTYYLGWQLPGGGVKKNETVLAAIKRELYEETGVQPTKAPQLINIYYHEINGVSDYPILYFVDSFKQEKVTSAEIAAIGWYDLKNLPDDISPATRKRLNEFFLNADFSGYWK